MFADGANIVCTPLGGPPPERNIHEQWEMLLMEVARHHDEIQRSNPTSPSDSSSEVLLSEESFGDLAEELEAVTESAAMAHDEDDGFDALWDEGVESLFEKRYSSAFLAFEKALEIRPGEPRCVANIERLRAMGHGPDATRESED